MDNRTAVSYMENEIRCIQRAAYCDRDCAKCNLVREDKPLLEAFGMAVLALEKQTPYKPKEYEDSYYACKCGNILMHKWRIYPTKLMPRSEGLPYCMACGQAIDWSDEIAEQMKAENEPTQGCEGCRFEHIAEDDASNCVCFHCSRAYSDCYEKAGEKDG